MYNDIRQFAHYVRTMRSTQDLAKLNQKRFEETGEPIHQERAKKFTDLSESFEKRIDQLTNEILDEPLSDSEINKMPNWDITGQINLLSEDRLNKVIHTN